MQRTLAAIVVHPFLGRTGGGGCPGCEPANPPTRHYTYVGGFDFRPAEGKWLAEHDLGGKINPPTRATSPTALPDHPPSEDARRVPDSAIPPSLPDDLWAELVTEDLGQ